MPFPHSHLSNSVYAEQGDFVRFKYAADFMGVVLTKDKCAILLGGMLGHAFEWGRSLR